MNVEPTVSVIVPTRNSASTLRACLTSIVEQRYPSIELIVVDRGSTDETCDIARAHGALLLSAEPERSAQRNAGARAARGEFVLFIDSDMVLEANVVGECIEAWHGSDARAAVVIPERGFADRLLTKIRSLEKRCYVGNEAVEAARFFPREPFLAVGGFDEALVAAEDWDLTDRWVAAGGTVARSDAFIIHDDRSLRLIALLKKRFFYGQQMLSYLRKQRGAGMSRLRAGRFLPRFPLLAREPLVAMGLLALKSIEVTTFALGLAVAAMRQTAATRRRPRRRPVFRERHRARV